MSKITDKQVVLIKTTVSSKAKQLGINPVVAQNEVKKLAAQLHDYDDMKMSIKDVDSDLFEALLESIDGVLKPFIEQKDSFSVLSKIDFSGKIDKKGKFSYVSWAWAWSETKKHFPTASFEIKWFDGKPYFIDSFGVTIYTSITIDGLTHEMWLPVMDSSNKSKKPASIDSMDINKTTMRCLTKNLALFGVGLYVYAGEDLPDIEEINPVEKIQQINKEQSDNFINQITDLQAQFLPQRKLSEVGKEFIGFINLKYGLQIQSSKEIPASLFEEINSNIENLFKEAFGI